MSIVEADQKPLNYVVETVLKKRKTNEEWALKRKEKLGAKRKEESNSNRQSNGLSNSFNFFLFNLEALDLVGMKNRLKRRNVNTDDIKFKLLFVVRIHGNPNLKSVKELIYKKGCGKIKKENVPLTNNDVIEQALGQYGMICVEDLVHEIVNVGPYFNEANKFLLPFKRKCPERRLCMKKRPFKSGGDTGNHEDKINELISKLN
ncbi:hypothetical protein LUZ60_017115 [Juncus effusus]|nr:hypothetical protein LUZ60_017115 [Juncus effusus]